MWTEYMVEKYNITKTIGSKLANLIKNEQFTGNNFYTPRSVDKAVNMLINEVETPYKREIFPILAEPIKNPFNEEVNLGDRMLMPNEMISWIDLIKLKNKL
jgi:hypothetical protein